MGTPYRFPPTLLASGSNTITLSSRIFFDKGLTIKGLIQGTDTLFLSGGTNNHIFEVDASSNVCFNSVVIVDGLGSFGGGIRIRNADTVFVKNSVFLNNETAQSGGAIHSNGAAFLSIQNSYFSGNEATFNGGAIYSLSPTLALIENSTITNNVAEVRDGGGVYVNSNVTINGCEIAHNTAGEAGGGVFVTNSTIFLNSSSVHHNTATLDGGGLRALFVEVSNSSVSNNTANDGGGIRFFQHLIVSQNSSIDHNTALSDGGGTYAIQGVNFITIENSSISHNSAGNQGGGIYHYASSGSLSTIEVSLDHATISHNTATAGGGGIYSTSFFSAFTFFNITNSTLNHNQANFNGGTGSGGAIFSRGSVTPSLLNISNSTLSANAAFSGGAILAFGIGSTINLQTSTLSFNQAVGDGGGILSNASGSTNVLNLTNSTLYNNAAQSTFHSADVDTINVKGSIVFTTQTGDNLAFITINSAGYNLFSNASFGGSLASDNFLIDSLQLNLGPLQDNGGATFTHAPLVGSIAIDGGDPTDFSDAQNRPIQGIRDRGAAENDCNSYTPIDTATCSPFFWLQNGITYFADTTVSDTLFGMSSTGCDSILTLFLTIYPTTELIEQVTACGSYTWPQTGVTYFTNTTVSDTLFGGNINGCDSIVTLDLTLFQSTDSIQQITACQAFTWPHNGVTYSSDITVTDTLFGGNANGCDSIVRLELTILPIANATQNITACGSYTWQQTGMVFTNDTVVSDTVLGGSANGCDSVVTLELIVHPIPLFVETISACSEFLWPQDGLLYTNDTLVFDTLFNGSSAGCDSIVALDLTLEDDLAPVPDLADLPLISSACPIAQIAVPTATDNCAGAISGTTSTTFPINSIGTTLITWTFDDGSGNVTTQMQEVSYTPLDSSVIQLSDSLMAVAAGLQYQWLDCNNGNAPIPGAINQLFIPANSGTYAVEISNDTCVVTSACITLTVGISEADLPSIKIYPNPVNTLLTLKSNSNPKAYQIYDTSGRLVLNGLMNSTTTQVDVAKLQRGFYLIHIQDRMGNQAHLDFIKH